MNPALKICGVRPAFKGVVRVKLGKDVQADAIKDFRTWAAEEGYHVEVVGRAQ